jgi:F0F1-type ATP synthase membrane subunit b/b'
MHKFLAGVFLGALLASLAWFPFMNQLDSRTDRLENNLEERRQRQTHIDEQITELEQMLEECQQLPTGGPLSRVQP